MSTGQAVVQSERKEPRRGRAARWLGRHWAALMVAAVGLYALLPWLAPLFMRLGWTHAGEAVYVLYGTQCHQLPQRSFFLFGRALMYPLPEIQAAFQQSSDPLVLRQFLGNAEMGWKVAWSDRMVAMYTGIPIWAAVFWAAGRPARRLPWWALGLLLLPLTLDGATHMLSDLTGGIGGGFRDSNAWLAGLTGNALPVSFYAGDAVGSFNSWLRLISGVLFSLGVVWLAASYWRRLSAAAHPAVGATEPTG
jgi:uncharacterized membrane protein